MSCIAAIQYALANDPGSSVLGATDAAKNMAAFRLVDNKWIDKEWFAETWSDWTGGSPTANATPGGSINYTGISIQTAQMFGSTLQNGRAALRDNGNHQAPYSQAFPGLSLPIKQSQLYGTLIQARVRVVSPTANTSCFIGVGRTHVSVTSLLDGAERLTGFLADGAASNWRAVSLRNLNPNDGITPAVIKKDTDTGIGSGVFNSMQLDLSAGGKRANWRIQAGAFPTTPIPIVTTATADDLLSRPGEGSVVWGAEVRELSTGSDPLTASLLTLGRFRIWAFRPGYVGSKPSYRFN